MPEKTKPPMASTDFNSTDMAKRLASELADMVQMEKDNIDSIAMVSGTQWSSGVAGGGQPPAQPTSPPEPEGPSLDEIADWRAHVISPNAFAPFEEVSHLYQDEAEQTADREKAIKAARAVTFAEAVTNRGVPVGSRPKYDGPNHAEGRAAFKNLMESGMPKLIFEAVLKHGNGWRDGMTEQERAAVGSAMVPALEVIARRFFDQGHWSATSSFVDNMKARHPSAPADAWKSLSEALNGVTGVTPAAKGSQRLSPMERAEIYEAMKRDSGLLDALPPHVLDQIAMPAPARTATQVALQRKEFQQRVEVVREKILRGVRWVPPLMPNDPYPGDEFKKSAPQPGPILRKFIDKLDDWL